MSPSKIDSLPQFKSNLKGLIPRKYWVSVLLIYSNNTSSFAEFADLSQRTQRTLTNHNDDIA